MLVVYICDLVSVETVRLAKVKQASYSSESILLIVHYEKARTHPAKATCRKESKFSLGCLSHLRMYILFIAKTGYRDESTLVIVYQQKPGTSYVETKVSIRVQPQERTCGVKLKEKARVRECGNERVSKEVGLLSDYVMWKMDYLDHFST